MASKKPNAQIQMDTKISDKNLLLKTSNNNNYLLNTNTKTFYYLHPLLKYLYEKHMSNELDQAVNRKEIILNDITYTQKDIKYYYQKLKMFILCQVFEQDECVRTLDGQLSRRDIEYQLANSTQVVFEVTDKCNLNCKYCIYGDLYNDNNKGRKQTNLKPEVAFSFLDYLKTYWDSNLNNIRYKEINISFYGGEPLLNFPLITEIVNYLKDKNTDKYSFIFSLTTNATLLHQHIEYFIQNNFNLTLSLDGDEKANKYRIYHSGKPSFANVFDNICFIQKTYPEYFIKYCNFLSVFNDQSDYSNIKSFFSENFNKDTSIGELNPLSNNANFNKFYKSIYKSIDYYELLKEVMLTRDISILPDSYQRNATLNLLTSARYQDFNAFFDFNIQKNYIPTGTCIPFSRKIFLTVNGDIFPCERILHGNPIGKSSAYGTFIDFEKILKNYNSDFKSIKKHCDVCLKRFNCLKCIYGSFKNFPLCDELALTNHNDSFLEKEIAFYENFPSIYSNILDSTYV